MLMTTDALKTTAAELVAHDKGILADDEDAARAAFAQRARRTAQARPGPGREAVAA